MLIKGYSDIGGRRDAKVGSAGSLDFHTVGQVGDDESAVFEYETRGEVVGEDYYRLGMVGDDG